MSKNKFGKYPFEKVSIKICTETNCGPCVNMQVFLLLMNQIKDAMMVETSVFYVGTLNKETVKSSVQKNFILNSTNLLINQLMIN